MEMVTVEDVQLAAKRIAPYVRRTPMVPVRCAMRHPFRDGELWLKLECLQVTGSFKPRGATNKLLLLSEAALARGIVTASGGNHGLGVAYAGWLHNVKTTVFVPENVSPDKARKLEQWGAAVWVRGRHWDEANREALALADREGLAYFHPFADPAVIAGQGTVALEILEQAPEVDTILAGIGGGGLISGIAVAAKALRSSVRIIGIEPVGAPTLHAALRAGRVVSLPEIATRVPTFAALRTEAVNFEIVRRHVEEVVLIEDEAMEHAARWLWFEMGIAADLSGAAAIAALQSGAVRPRRGSRVCALVCGAGPDGIGAFPHGQTEQVH
jgi:threonine dehydratase